MSFANIPSVLDLSYLSISPRSWGVSAMGNLVEGDSEADSYVHAVRAVLVTWAPASDWPEWAARDSSGYSHEVEAAIYEVERNGAGTLTNFEPLIASRSLVHVPWRPTEAPDGSPYPYNGHAFEIAIPFVESVELPDEYMVLISYNTESEGTNPLGEAGPYDSLNYGLSRSEVRSGNDLDPASLVQITPTGWNYSASWGGLGSLMTEVVSRSVEEMEEIPSEQPARVGEYLTAFYEDGEFVEQATVRILPRPITLRASPQERVYGNAMVLDETAFAVTDLDGDGALPNGEVIDTVALNSATGVNVSTTSNVGTYADEIAITGQSGSNGFNASNYDLSYLTGDLVVNPRAVSLTASQQERAYGNTIILDETAFTITDLDGDSALPNGEVIDAVALNSATGVDISTTSNVGTYADEIAITAQAGSNGFSASNYDLAYVTGGLVVNQRAVTLTASSQERIYGEVLVLDETAFTVTDLDGDSALPNGEVIDTVVLNSATGVDISTTSNVGTYAAEIAITGQAGSNGFSAGNYALSYVAGDLVVSQRGVTLTASLQNRAYGDTMVLDETAFTVTDLDGDSALPNGEVVDTVILNSDAGVNVGTYADAIAITGQAGSNGFSVGNYDLSYVAGDLVVNPRALTLTALPQERIYGDAIVLEDTAFTVMDLDGDGALPNGEVIDTVILNSDAGGDVGAYGEAITITGQSGSNGFSVSNYDLTYVAGDLVVNERAVTLTALQQERIYGDTLVLDETAFTVTDLDGDNVLPNGEVIDTVALSGVTGVDISATSNVGAYADEIEITGQAGSNGFSVGNYDLRYVAGDLVVNPRAVILTALPQERAYGDTLVLDEMAFFVTDLDGDSVLPNEETIDAVMLNSSTGVDSHTTAEVGVYADEIEITGQAGSNGFDADNYELSYVTGDLAVVAQTYEGWIRSFLESGSISPLDDPDLDGLTNLMEYALGSNPLSGVGRPPVEVSEAGMFSGQISADLFATTVVLERSYDLQNWLEITPDWQENGSLRSWEWSDSGRRRVFVRMRVERAP